MLSPGIYAVSIGSPHRQSVQTFAVIDTAKIIGGDFPISAVFRGTHKTDGTKTVAEIEVENLTSQTSPLFGSFKKLHLKLAGQSNAGAFTLTGTVVEQPQMSVTVIGERKAGLF